MKKETKPYTITLIDNGVKSEKEVQGKPVKFEGFEGFEFFVHHQAVVDYWGNWDNHVITEVSSGSQITGDFTEEGAIARAKHILSKSSPEELAKRIEKVKQDIANLKSEK